MRSTTIKLGDDQFTIAALNLGQLEDAMPVIQSMRVGDAGSQLGKLLDVMQIALREAYPEVVVRKLHSDMTELRAAFSAIMSISGFEMKVPASGEATAGENSTSETSAAA